MGSNSRLSPPQGASAPPPQFPPMAGGGMTSPGAYGVGPSAPPPSMEAPPMSRGGGLMSGFGSGNQGIGPAIPNQPVRPSDGGPMMFAPGSQVEGLPHDPRFNQLPQHLGGGGTGGGGFHSGFNPAVLSMPNQILGQGNALGPQPAAPTGSGAGFTQTGMQGMGQPPSGMQVMPGMNNKMGGKFGAPAKGPWRRFGK